MGFTVKVRTYLLHGAESFLRFKVCKYVHHHTVQIN